MQGDNTVTGKAKSRSDTGRVAASQSHVSWVLGGMEPQASRCSLVIPKIPMDAR